MKEKIDSEKIIRHIKYTRHWLDKANDDFTEQRFSTGGMILNLARAEITAALEEALMLKSRVAAKIPARRPSVKWGVASSVSLLASGFIIAVLIIQFTSNPIPRPEGMKTPSTRIVQEIAPAPAPAASVEPEKALEPTAIETPAPARGTAHRRSHAARRAAAQPVVSEPAPAPEPVAVEEQPVEEFIPVAEPAPQVKTDIKQSEVIDLYRTAKEALDK